MSTALRAVLTVGLFLAPRPAAPQGAAPGASAPDRLAEARLALDHARYGEAEGIARGALATLEGRGAGESLAAADLLDVVTSALYRSGRERGGDTLALARRAVALRERLQGRDYPATAASLQALADVLRRNGDLAGAGPLYERAMEIRERAFGPRSLEAADGLNGLGNFLYDSGDCVGAGAFYACVLEIRSAQLGPDRPEVADALVNLAAVALSAGDYTGARELFERAAAIRERALGSDHPTVASALNNLAIALKGDGDYPGARRCYERALVIWENAFGPEHTYVAGALNNLASLAIRMGDPEAARPLLERSLAIREKALGPDHPEVAQGLTNLAEVLRETGELEAAKRHLERALAIRERTLGPVHRDVAVTLASLREVLAALGDAEGAHRVGERVLAIRERTLGPEHPLVAESLHALAILDADHGELESARASGERALAIWTRALGTDHPNVALGSVTLAGVLARQGERDRALALALAAEEIGRNHLSLTAHLLAEREALRYAAIRATGRDLALTLIGDGAPTAAQRRSVWEAVARSRNVVFDAMAERRRFIATTHTAGLEPLRAELLRANDEVARLLVRSASGDAPDRTLASLGEARRRKERAERALADRSPAFGAEQARLRVRLVDVASGLPPDTALVSLVRYRHTAVNRRPTPTVRAGERSSRQAETSSGPAYVALVVRAGRHDVAVVTLGSADEIDGLVARWAAEAARGELVAGRSPGEALRAYRQAGRELRRRVWDPLVPDLQGASRVFLVTDGGLSLVSWTALPVGRNGYLAESGPVLHLLTAERDILVPDRPASRGRGLLALGGAAFDSRPSVPPEIAGPVRPLAERSAAAPPTTPGPPGCGVLGGSRFEALPASEKEVDEIAAIWRDAASTGASGAAVARGRGDVQPEVVVLKGTSAGEAAFRAASRGRRVVHLATHGFFLGGDCLVEAPRARGIGGLAAGPGGPPPHGGGPPPLSGLALAGANLRLEANSGEDDGVLTSEEIATLDLAGVEWAVLSACDTGLGELHASEGVLGLRRAFRAAGVSTVIMSLWTVEDEAAREWMAALYRARLVDGLSTAEAMRAAERRILASRRDRGLSSHPFHWGAFVAAGDWR